VSLDHIDSVLHLNRGRLSESLRGFSWSWAGTGKTRTACHLINIAVKLNERRDAGKVLAVAFSNVAADNLLEGQPPGPEPMMMMVVVVVMMMMMMMIGCQLRLTSSSSVASPVPLDDVVLHTKLITIIIIVTGCLRLGLNAVRVGRAATVRPEFRNHTLDALIANHESVTTFRKKAEAAKALSSKEYHAARRDLEDAGACLKG
jgi:hypothetical protein